MRPRLLAVLVLVLAGAPAAARAATVEVTSDPVARTSSFRVVGEEGGDSLRITNAGGHALDVVDSSQPVGFRPAPGSPDASLCTAVDEHHVHCASPDVVSSVEVDAGGGNDAVTVDGSTGLRVLLGGEGDDSIRIRQDQLGDGQVLDLGPGRNSLFLDAAPHRVQDPPVDEPLVVDLAAGWVTSPRGTTTLLGVHYVRVTARNAIVLGDDGPNVVMLMAGGLVDGRGGNDLLSAESGAATLIGGDGDDAFETGGTSSGHVSHYPAIGSTVDGGPGNDHLHVPQAAHVTCGSGPDAVSLDQLTRPADCEGSPTWFGFLGPVADVGPALRVSVKGFYSGCGLRVRALTRGGRPVTEPVRTRRDGPMSLRLPLIGAGARLPAVVRLDVRMGDSCPLGRGPWRYLAGNAERPAAVVTIAAAEGV